MTVFLSSTPPSLSRQFHVHAADAIQSTITKIQQMNTEMHASTHRAMNTRRHMRRPPAGPEFYY